MHATATPQISEGVWTDRYWLQHCDGFRVESAAGRIGLVDEVLPAVKALRIRVGLLGRRTLVVPLSEVERIEPRAEQIVLRPSFSVLASEALPPRGGAS